MSDDARVRARYQAWRAPHAALIARLRADAAPEDVRAFGDAIMHDQEHHLRELARFVRIDLGCTYGWLNELLLAQFRAWAYSEARGENVALMMRHPSATRLRAPGRRMKNKGRDLVRDVEWLYRTEIRVPRESAYAIAQEYARAEERHTRSDSVVQNGVKRVKSLLAAVGKRPAETI